MQKYVNLVDLVKSFLTSIYLQKSASIQPRTSLSNLGGKFNSLFIRLLTREKVLASPSFGESFSLFFRATRRLTELGHIDFQALKKDAVASLARFRVRLSGHDLYLFIVLDDELSQRSNVEWSVVDAINANIPTGMVSFTTRRDLTVRTSHYLNLCVHFS